MKLKGKAKRISLVYMYERSNKKKMFNGEKVISHLLSKEFKNHQKDSSAQIFQL